MIVVQQFITMLSTHLRKSINLLQQFKSSCSQIGSFNFSISSLTCMSKTSSSKRGSCLKKSQTPERSNKLPLSSCHTLSPISDVWQASFETIPTSSLTNWSYLTNSYVRSSQAEVTTCHHRHQKVTRLSYPWNIRRLNSLQDNISQKNETTRVFQPPATP